ncbi:unnamed protein product [Closterium sp. Naga37s-1]|nr:unnamed protein product [Closterium sp. Naga37s-1]CAI5986848.1 unnamed protein product [Closterium sp. NIES-65]
MFPGKAPSVEKRLPTPEKGGPRGTFADMIAARKAEKGGSGGGSAISEMIAARQQSAKDAEPSGEDPEVTAAKAAAEANRLAIFNSIRFSGQPSPGQLKPEERNGIDRSSNLGGGIGESRMAGPEKRTSLSSVVSNAEAEAAAAAAAAAIAAAGTPGGPGGGFSRDGPSPPVSIRRPPSRGAMSFASSSDGEPSAQVMPWGGSPAPRLGGGAGAERGGGGFPVSAESPGGRSVASEMLTLDNDDVAGGGPVVAALQAAHARRKQSDRSYFQKAEEMYSLQVAVALRLIEDAEMAEETEMAPPQANPNDMLWASPLMPRSQAEATAYRFWVNGCLSYEDRIEDGFYDIWGMQPYVYSLCVDSSHRGRMPPLDSLRALHPSEASFDVALINRTIDAELKDLEDEAVNLAYAATEVQTLAQKLGVLVAHHMGGAVNSEPNELIPRFRQRGWEIKSYLKTIVLPIGQLPVGICRHRALLFKVLADALGMPCRIQKGCKFCGMDDGASCLVLASDEREYVVDLLQRPGTLLTIEPSAESATSTATNATYIASPLRCPEIKSLALTDPADGTVPQWVPDFRRQQQEQDAEAMVGSRRIYAGGPKDPRHVAASPKGERRRKELKEVEEEEDSEEEEEKKPQKKAGKKGGGEEDEGKKKAKAPKQEAAPPADDEAADAGVEFMDVLMDGRIMDIGEAEIDWNDIEMGERVGAGSFGTVYRAEWAGCDVAVKVLINQDMQEEQLLEFKREVVIMRRLRHPNIVLFMGAVTKPPHLSILTEFLSRGSLFRLLHRPGAKETLKEDRRIRMAMDIARGINYLHHCTPMIVHRDLKTPNLLVDKNFTVKVCDFGLSRNKNSTFLSSKSGAGTPEWMAPEVLRNEPSNEKSDVYSFGVILWELVTLLQPWDGMNPMQVVGAVGFQNQRLTVPPDLDPALSTLILDCWHNDPKDRPKFDDIMVRLKPIAQKAAAGKNVCGGAPAG